MQAIRYIARNDTMEPTQPYVRELVFRGTFRPPVLSTRFDWDHRWTWHSSSQAGRPQTMPSAAWRDQSSSERAGCRRPPGTAAGRPRSIEQRHTRGPRTAPLHRKSWSDAAYSCERHKRPTSRASQTSNILRQQSAHRQRSSGEFGKN